MQTTTTSETEAVTPVTERTVAEYTIHSFRLGGCNYLIEKLNKRCHRLHIPELKLEVVGTSTKEAEDRDGFKYTKHYTTVRLTGTAPKLAGWEFAATFEHDSETGLTIFRRNSEFKVEIPTDYRKAKNECDHCKKIRNRNDTYLCYNAEKGEFKQVGRTCIKDFLGHKNPHWALECATMWYDLTDFMGDNSGEDEGWGGGGGHSERVVGTEEFLDNVFAVVKVYGFVSKTKAQESCEADRPLEATKERVLNYMFPAPDQLKSRGFKAEMEACKPTEESKAQALTALDWIRSMKEDAEANKLSEFLMNLYISCAGDILTMRRTGIVAALSGCYLRHLEGEKKREEEKKTRKPSNYVGNVGERLRDMVLLVKRVIPREHDFGVTYITGLEDADGNQFTWFSSSENLTAGATYKVTGTVKDQNDKFHGIPTTILSRCKCEELPAPKETK